MPTGRNAFQFIVLIAFAYIVLYMTYTLISSGRNLPPVVATAITSRLSELSNSWSSLASNLTEASNSSGAALPTSSSPQKTYYMNLAWQDAVAADIPPNLYVRQINQESGFNTNEVSSAGAIGIAQFMPGTAAGLGIDPWDPVQSLQGAARLMANYNHNYGNYAKALAAYNGGSGNLAAAMNNCADQWLSCEPAETQRYVHVILNQ